MTTIAVKTAKTLFGPFPQTIYSPTNYVKKINETLRILYDNIPRAFVNLVEIFDITPLAKVAQGFLCTLVTK